MFLHINSDIFIGALTVHELRCLSSTQPCKEKKTVNGLTTKGNMQTRNREQLGVNRA